MKSIRKFHIVLLLLLCLATGNFQAVGQETTTPLTLPGDTLKAGQLRMPDNIRTVVEYDAKNRVYLIRRKLGDIDLEVPRLMTEQEYLDWTMRQSMQSYYRQKNGEEAGKKKDEFDFLDMKFDLGPAEKIFGPGGVQIKTQGSAELSFGVNYKNVKNPSLPESQRKTWGFDFDEKVNVNVNGKVGDKVDMNMNYNTDATFDFDTKQLKLKYEGKEDEIIKLIEAGNVSLTSNNSLIKGASTLFGLRTDLQFGKLKLQTVISQQESESKTVTSKGGVQTTSFDFQADNYEENRHFFLAHYFRDTYDKSMAQLPNILSGVTINRIEVWVTNKRGNYDNPRNIVAFTDLGEAFHIDNPTWQGGGLPGNPSSTLNAPANSSNTLYQQMTTAYVAARDISQVNSTLGAIPGMEGGVQYEKIENARLLSSSEYTLNTKLGYAQHQARLPVAQTVAATRRSAGRCL